MCVCVCVCAHPQIVEFGVRIPVGSREQGQSSWGVTGVILFKMESHGVLLLLELP